MGDIFYDFQDIDYAENATKTYADLMSSKFTQVCISVMFPSTRVL